MAVAFVQNSNIVDIARSLHPSHLSVVVSSRVPARKSEGICASQNALRLLFASMCLP